jgi:two-component system phosphate regulon response regulator PhoB
VTQRVLVVDDEPDITAHVAYHLAKEGYRVSTAHSGPEALKAASEQRPDLVVLDLMLPGMSGYEVLQELRSRADTSDVGVVTRKRSFFPRSATIRRECRHWLMTCST